MRRRGFTILELFIVIGILAILMAVLLPVLWRARGAAMKVICSARLRDLTLATTMYQQQHRVFPDAMKIANPAPGSTAVHPAPQRISTELLNQLRPYLTFPEIQPTSTIDELPPFLQCPFVESERDARGPFANGVLTAGPSYYTGFAYMGRLSEVSVPAPPPPPPPPGPTPPPFSLLPIPLPIALPSLPLVSGLLPMLEPGIELKPGRSADAKASKRAVLWSDNVCQMDSAGLQWQYSHTRRAARTRSSLTYASPAELLGQHRAYTDGSVEWVDAGTPELDVSTPAQSEKTASFKTLLGEHWWF